MFSPLLLLLSSFFHADNRQPIDRQLSQLPMSKTNFLPLIPTQEILRPNFE
jgi:hypothetical protein